MSDATPTRESLPDAPWIGDPPQPGIGPSNSRQQAILDHIPSDADRILDVGCVNHDADAATDANWLHQHLYQAADHVLGIDILQEDVHELQQDGYNVVQADAQDFALNQTFDVVVAGELIEHVENPGRMLACVRDHLDSDGRLVLTTPNAWCGLHSIQALFPGEVSCNPEHVAWYDERTLRQLLERCGYEVEAVEYIAPPPDWASSRIDRAAFSVLGAAYRLGFRMLGAPTILVDARPVEDEP